MTAANSARVDSAEPPSVVPVAAALALLVAIPIAVVAAVVLAVLGGPWWLGILIGLVAGVVLVLIAIRSSMSRTLSGLGVTGTASGGNARLENLVEGLSLSIGLSEPELHVVTDPALNALSLAQGEREAVLITSGLLDAVDRVGLEGVVAELLIRIKNGDAEAATIASGLAGPMLDGPLSGALRPLGARVIAALLPEDREFRADLAAVSVTRYPPGLSAALGTIAQGSHRPAVARPSNDHLWLAPPLDGESIVPSPPLDWRIDTLMEI